MRKIVLFCFTFSLFAISVALFLKSIQEKRLMNPLVLANVEAIALIKGGGDGDDGSWGNGTCGYISWSGDSWNCLCGISQAEALHWFAHWGNQQNWCCNSCSTTAYCSPGAPPCGW